MAQIRNFVSGPNILAFFDLPWVPVFLAAIGFLHPLLGGMACVSTLFLFALAFLNDRLTRDRTRAAGETTMQAMQAAEAGCRNAEAVDALGMADAVVGRWMARHDAALQLSDVVARRTGWIVGVSRAARLTIQVLMTGAGAWLVLRQEFTGGAMIAGSIMLARALAPVDRSISAWKAFVACRAAHERLRRHLQAPILRPASMALPSPCGRLDLEGVGLALPGCDRLVLHDVGFALPAGEALAIIGPSAAGKSSLARLIVGARPPTAGHVRLDGADIAWLDRTRLGPFLGYLPQDVELFAGTVAENIARMGRMEPEAVVAAARLAGAHGMILRLPRGYETEIGEGGCHLSGGQRQRVALARALYGDPRLVVLDEPDASLDAEGQEALLQALDALKARGCSIVAVTHKHGLLDRMDKLAVLVQGRLSLFGPRDEVLAGIARSQASAARGEAAE